MAYQNTSTISTPTSTSTGKLPPLIPGMPGYHSPFDQWKIDARRKKRRMREVFRRQRILVANGYKIVIDGTWGPRSQRAWQTYLKSGSYNTILNERNRVPQDKLDLRKKPGQTEAQAPAPKSKNANITLEQDRARARREAARKADEARRKKEAEALAKRTALLKAKPQLARNLNVHQITQVLKSADYHPEKNPNLTKALQFFLRSKGYKVNTNGVLGRNTWRALQKEEKKQMNIERDAALKDLAEHVFAGSLKPGDEPSWWQWGPMPTPEKLLKLLQEDSFQGNMMFRTLLAYIETPQYGFDLARAHQLNQIVQNLSPNSPSAMMARIAGENAVEPWQYAMDIYAQTDLAPLDDWSAKAGFTDKERLMAMTARSKDQDVRAENAARILATRTQVDILLGASTAEEYQREWFANAKKTEKEFEQVKQKIASYSTPWWGEAVSALNWTAEMGSSVVIAASLAGGGGTTVGPVGTALGRNQKAEKSILHPLTPAQANEQILQEMNPLLRYAFEFTFDPLMMMRPLRLASTGVAIMTAKRTGLFGAYVIGGRGAGKLVTYEAGKLTAGGTLSAVTRGYFYAAGIRGTAFSARLAEYASKMSATTNEMTGAITERLVASGKLGWATPKFKVSAQADHVVPKLGVGSKEAEAIMATARQGARAFFPKAALVRVLRTELERTNGSLWVDHNRQTLSQVGSALEGHFMSTARPAHVARKSMERAQEVLDTSFHRQLVENGYDAATVPRVVADAYRAIAQREAQKAYEETYAKFRNYLFGSSDPTLHETEMRVKLKGEELAQARKEGRSQYAEKTVMRNLEAELNTDLAKLQKEFHMGFMAQLQDHLEDAATFKHELLQAEAKKAVEAGAAPAANLHSDAEWAQMLDRDRAQRLPTEEELADMPAIARYIPVIVNANDPSEVRVATLYSENEFGAYDHNTFFSDTEIFGSSQWDTEARAQHWVQGRAVIHDGEIAQVNLTAKGTEASFSTSEGLSPAKIKEMEESALEVARSKFKTADEPRVIERDAQGLLIRPKVEGTPANAPIAAKDIEHPMWDKDGKWHGRNSDETDDLTHQISRSFDEDRLVDIDNPAFGRSHTGPEMRAAIASEMATRLGRLNHYAARKIASDAISEGDKAIAALEHELRAEAIHDDIFSHWDQNKGDGWFYDDRDQLQVSNLYAREVDAHGKKSLIFDAETGEVRMLESLGINQPFDKMTKLEVDMYDLTMAMSGIHAQRIPGTEEFTQGARHGLDPEIVDEATQLREIIDLRMMALERYEKAAAPRMMKENGAVWMAWQHAQGRKMALAHKALSSQLMFWKFATLALRPAWAVRNFIDNIMKAIIAGARDPRLFIVGPGGAVGNAIGQGINILRDFVVWADTMYGTNAVHYFDEITNIIWAMPSEQISKLFESVNIPAPKEIFEMNLRHDLMAGAGTKTGLKFTSVPELSRQAELAEKHGLDLFRDTGRVEQSFDSAFGYMGDLAKRFGNVAFHMAGDIPENYARRIVYRAEYKKARKELLDEIVPVERTWPDDVVRIKVDDAQARKLIEDTLGMDKAEWVGVSFNRVSIEGDYLWDGLASVVDQGRGVQLQVNVPTDLAVGSAEHVQYIADVLGDTFLHELRHAKQFTGNQALGKVTRMVDAVLPYKYQMREIDARWWARKQADKAFGLFQVDADVKNLWRPLTPVEIELQATDRALKKVEDTLFNYSNISVMEDNLRIFFPFIQFWRKNSVFWAKSFATKPWLSGAAILFEADRREAHKDNPQWMQRYFHTDEMVDALGVVPGLDDAFEKMGLGNGAMFDPISLSSMAPFYRAFKSDNQFLPGEASGIPIIGALIDATNDWGLGMNPLFRKPLEAVGIANRRSWQRMYPQTSMAVAFGDWVGGDKGAAISRIAESMEIVASFGTAALNNIGPDQIAKNKDYWVQTVVAEQVARGETPNIAKAETVVNDWFLTMNLWGYFGGIYWRRATPEDIYLAKLQDSVMKGEVKWNKLTDAEKEQLKIWGMRGQSRLMYDNYIGLLPVIHAYFKAGDNFELKDEIKKANPEIIRYVDGDFNGRPVSHKFIRHTQRYVEQELFFDALDFADTLDVPEASRQAAYDMFMSPELKHYWWSHETPKRLRDRMIQGEAREFIKNLNKGFFAIPEDDFDARDEYMRDHPELQRSWDRNNSPSEDLEGFGDFLKANLRDSYFSVVEAHGGDDKGFQAAASFLKQFPFMFEGTKSERKIKDGEWIPGQGKWGAERIALYREAKPHLTWFFDTFLPKVGAKQAWAWLEKTDAENGTIIREYLNKYPSTKRLEYLKAQPWLKRYFGMPPAERGAWLRGGSEGAQIVLAFFKKYGDKQSQHAKDYLATKKDMDYYFSLPEETRSKWLDSNDPRAVKVKEYFKKYGKQHQFEKAFKKLVAKYPELAHGTPEQARRLEFWRHYFELPPDQRPFYVHSQAENHGVFIYGEFGEEYMHDREMDFMRKGIGIDVSKKMMAYLYAKPLLDFYKTLNADEKVLYAKANPEIQAYFDNHSNKSMTGDKKLDKLVEQYFALPADSLARSAFIKKHPDVQDWFDKRSTQAERAIRNILEQYFSLDKEFRNDFLDTHPEIQAYFDARRVEKDNERAQAEAFDDSDPRIAPFYEQVKDMERAAALMRAKLGNRALKAYDISTRRDRRTQK